MILYLKMVVAQKIQIWWQNNGSFKSNCCAYSSTPEPANYSPAKVKILYDFFVSFVIIEN